ncbi:MAG: hypothetical protein KA112_01045 [Alphaproteobacteria bacterium]|nr:hypothetical protein [Alphaproteobacteria bacterium]MBP7729187.1 hypothetical protein [Alphaproteobacteria bacterium]
MMKVFYLMVVLGLLMTGPSFNAFASVIQDMGLASGHSTHLLDTGIVQQKAASAGKVRMP